MAKQTLESQIQVLTDDVEAIKNRLRHMDDREASENALAVAARSDALDALELIPKIDIGVRALRDELKSEIAGVRVELRSEIAHFRHEVNGRFTEVNRRLDEHGDLLKKIADRLNV
jgi:hypothetical protein